jgi:hypothetical protein
VTVLIVGRGTKVLYGVGAAAFGVEDNGFSPPYRISHATHEANLRRLAGR